MLAELDAEIGKVRKDARARGLRNDRVQQLVAEKMKQAEESEKSRPKRGAMDLRGEDDGDEMELDNGQHVQDRAIGGGRIKRLGLGRNG